MKKILSLIKATMSSDMDIFKVKSKKNSRVVPIIFALFFMFYIWMYANIIMDSLVEVHGEILLLTLFVLLTSILTVIEGIYKSGSLLFNCKDDDLLLSLPLKKSTVLFIRIFKFYVFELLYNSLFLVPAMIVYMTRVHVDLSYYLISLLMLLLLPIIPVIISAIIGLVLSLFSSKFKHKNIIQIIFTFVIVLGVFYLVSTKNNFANIIAQNAGNINNAIKTMYYPAGVYINAITNFNLLELLLFIIINIVLFGLSTIVFSDIYFKTNSKNKEISVKTKKNTKYTIKTQSQYKALISKELKRFISSPVLVTNAGLGLVLHVIICILICTNYNSIIAMFTENEMMSEQTFLALAPCICSILICFSSLLTCITCSLISLEGKSFNILKSLPVNPKKIIFGKVFTSLLIMYPFLLVGDIVLFIRFKFNLLIIILLLIITFILPLFTEVLGIIFNLSFPKMDISSDAEAVKQSTSVMLSTFIGMGLAGITAFVTIILSEIMGTIGTLIMIISIFALATSILLIYLLKNGAKLFNRITV